MVTGEVEVPIEALGKDGDGAELQEGSPPERAKEKALGAFDGG
jgi:hypothetical protein